MENKDRFGIRYSIFDPTGNITALVEGDVPLGDRTSVAARIMAIHSEIEQVGFVRITPESSDVQAELQMAGGEFCGNASMCTAGLLLLSELWTDAKIPLKLRVSGASEPVFLSVYRADTDQFTASILMPPVKGIEEHEFSLNDMMDKLPLVRMGGISHIIIEPNSRFFSLKNSPEKAEQAVKTWCGMLSVECLGLMFLDRDEKVSNLTPLVYVPVCQTLFWEKSCASGSAAVGAYLANRSCETLDITLNEPGGSLRVEVCPDRKEVRMYETIRCIGRDLALP